MIGSARRFGVRFERVALLSALALAAWGCDRASPNAAQTQDTASQNGPAAEPTVSQESIEQSLQAAQEYLNSQETVKAQAILVTLIDRAPREVRARELYGQSLIDQASEAERQRDLEATAQLRLNAYEQYRIAAEITPDVAGLQQSAGMMALAAGNPDAAIEHFRAAGQLDNANPQYPLFEAQVLIAAKRFEEADAALRRVIELDADEPIAHASLSMIALERGNFDQALEAIAVARQIHPADVELRAQEARIHRRKGDPRRALELTLGLSAADRAREIIAFEIASAYGDLNELIKAAKAWEHCYQTNPVAPRAWYAAANAGMALLKAGEREQASLWMRQAQLGGANQPEVIALREALAQ